MAGTTCGSVSTCPASTSERARRYEGSSCGARDINRARARFIFHSLPKCRDLPAMMIVHASDSKHGPLSDPEQATLRALYAGWRFGVDAQSGAEPRTPRAADGQQLAGRRAHVPRNALPDRSRHPDRRPAGGGAELGGWPSPAATGLLGHPGRGWRKRRLTASSRISTLPENRGGSDHEDPGENACLRSSDRVRRTGRRAEIVVTGTLMRSARRHRRRGRRCPRSRCAGPPTSPSRASP